jgi:hypothetical protein
MGRTIPTDHYGITPTRLDSLARPCHGRSQQLEKCYNWAIAKSDSARDGATIDPRSQNPDWEPIGRRPSGRYEALV